MFLSDADLHFWWSGVSGHDHFMCNDDNMERQEVVSDAIEDTLRDALGIEHMFDRNTSRTSSDLFLNSCDGDRILYFWMNSIGRSPIGTRMQHLACTSSYLAHSRKASFNTDS